MQASLNRRISVPDTPNVQLLYAILPDIAKYLNIDVVVMYMFQKGCITDDDYHRINKVRESGGNIRVCTELAVLVHKNRSLDSFILALEQSTAQHAGHDDILRRIREEQNRRESLPTIEPASPPILVVPGHSTSKFPREGITEGPYFPGVNESLTKAEPILLPITVSQFTVL